MKNAVLSPVPVLLAFMLLVSMIFAVCAHAQPYPITVTANPVPAALNDEIALSLSITDELDFYYAELNVSYDTDMLEFLSVANSGLSEGGLCVSGELAPGCTGVSVSRTEALENPASGSFMTMHFKVKSASFADSTLISFANLAISNSEGNEIPSVVDPEFYLDIQEDIGKAGLYIPASNTVDEGETFRVTVRVFAAGITDTSRVHTWVALNSEDTDPSLWKDSLWIGVDASEIVGDSVYFSRDVAYGHPAGTWYLAARSALDGGDFKYGGLEGLWDSIDHPSAVLDIAQQPPYRYTLVKWDFDDETMEPSLFVPWNQDARIEPVGASLSGFVSGAGGKAASSKYWNEGGNGSKYWMTTFSTEGFAELELSSKLSGSGTGPRDFMLQASADGTSWLSIEDGSITVADNWTSGILDAVALPAALNGKGEVFVRWVMVSDSSVNDDIVQSTGTSRLDELVITGVNPSPRKIMVHPGDANYDSLVNADDVLPLGAYWLNRGPLPVYNTSDFVSREVEEWVPADASYADTRGDGIINHSDLKLVGVHFGKSVAVSKKSYTLPLSHIEIDPLPADSSVSLMIKSGYTGDLKGVAFSLEVDGIVPEQWSVDNLSPYFCPQAKRNELISFQVKKGQLFEAAYAFKGCKQTLEAGGIVKFDIAAVNDWLSVATISLNRVTVSNPQSTKQRLVLPVLSVEQGIEKEGKGTHVFQNMPNPCNLVTHIAYELQEETHIQLVVYDSRGKEVAMPLNQNCQEGYHILEVDVSGFEPGLYIYRMLTGTGYDARRKMCIVR